MIRVYGYKKVPLMSLMKITETNFANVRRTTIIKDFAIYEIEFVFFSFFPQNT